MTRSPKCNSPESSDPLADVRATFERLCRQGQSGPGRVVDCQAALERLEDDWQLFRDLVGFYLADIPQLAAAVKQAVAGRDARRLEHAAHQLAGFICNFDAHAAVVAARRLQAIGQGAAETLDDRALADANQACESMDDELAKVTEILQQFDSTESKNSARGG